MLCISLSVQAEVAGEGGQRGDRELYSHRHVQRVNKSASVGMACRVLHLPYQKVLKKFYSILVDWQGVRATKVVV